MASFTYTSGAPISARRIRYIPPPTPPTPPVVLYLPSAVIDAFLDGEEFIDAIVPVGADEIIIEFECLLSEEDSAVAVDASVDVAEDGGFDCFLTENEDIICYVEER